MSDSKTLWVTDFDGTLLSKSGAISPADIDALVRLQHRGDITVIATGRSLYSLHRVLPENIPIDYVIFSTGAGILDMRTGKVFAIHNMDSHDVSALAKTLLSLKVDFMIQETVPNNHHFHYWSHAGGNLDFKRRIEIYKQHCQMLAEDSLEKISASQAIVIIDSEMGLPLMDKLLALFPQFKVVRTTSPIDHQTMWIEIFPKEVSKGHGLERLCEHLQIPTSHAVAIGNDFNDLDMLEIAGMALVVDDAPEYLKNRFKVISSRAPIQATLDKYGFGPNDEIQ